MSYSNLVKIVYGAGNWGAEGTAAARVTTVKDAQALIDTLRRHNITTIDTSRNYPRGKPGTSESLIGQTDAHEWMSFDTKVFSETGDHKASRIAESIDGSLQVLKASKLHLEYLHWPDRSTPLEETLGAVDKAFREGKFERFGVSNYSVEEIERMLAICEANGYIKPTVYQGQYNGLARRAEKQLLPTLRKNNIAYYAYSPGAGGAFNANSSRMNAQNPVGDLFRAWYGNESTTRAIQQVVTVAERYNLTGHELSLRWVLHHSALSSDLGDAIIVGASRADQLEETLVACEQGPLPQQLVTMMNELWTVAEATAPSYSPFVGMEGRPVELKR